MGVRLLAVECLILGVSVVGCLRLSSAQAVAGILVTVIPPVSPLAVSTSRLRVGVKPQAVPAPLLGRVETSLTRSFKLPLAASVCVCLCARCVTVCHGVCVNRSRVGEEWTTRTCASCGTPNHCISRYSLLYCPN